jgi:hypothetical protein
VEYLEAGRHGVLLGIVDGRITANPLSDVIAREKPLDARLIRLAQMLAE